MTDNEKLEKFLSEQKFMVLAVTLDDGTPWAVPLRIQLQWGSVFEWDSKLDAAHSKALRKHYQTAITIFENKPDSQVGFYARGKGELVEAREDGFGRYRFTAEKAWINDETFVKREISL